MDRSDTEIILTAIFEAFRLAATDNKSISYVFSCDTPKGPRDVKITVEPYIETEVRQDHGTH